MQQQEQVQQIAAHDLTAKDTGSKFVLTFPISVPYL